MGVWIFLPAFLCPQPTDRSGWALVERSRPLAVLLEAGSAKRQEPRRRWPLIVCKQGNECMVSVATHLSYKRASLFLRSSSHSLRLSR